MTDEVGREPQAEPRGLLPVFLVVVVALIAVVSAVWILGDLGDDDGDDTVSPSSVDPPPTAVSVVPTTEPVPTEATATYEAACGQALAATVSPGVADPNLVEVSGLAVDRAGVAWVINDSGDRPRIYGVRSDGSVQTVEVAGADAVDWEDVVLQHAGDRSVLWIADTGTNIEPRTTVQLYRVPVRRRWRPTAST